MALGVYLNFEKESREVIAFYEQVFNAKCTDLFTFADLPPNPEFPVANEIKDLIMNASLMIENNKVMFSDVPPNMGLTLNMGNNITLVIDTQDEAKLTQQFNDLAKEGKVIMPLDKTFWSEKYGYVIDKYGIGWQFNLSK
ncbi:VOC family protein [Bacillus benzoevorans]|uniref:PhnB protein n=1 Tax=Bacillus benzoevorans TaxID=1456 RepID=A0A7X0LUU4_9BACI|nr:glyoxalase/bleomycin resistance/extradiol dioxygenase family protein [Bacillus benzoevorans]MBB6444820.1 PhnB protein [Bacillus benzoevorans]